MMFSMAQPVRKPATYADFEALPPNVVGEIIEGELYASPRPAIPHARATSRLGARLGRAFDDDDGDGPGGWILLYEPELHLGADVVVPDIRSGAALVIAALCAQGSSELREAWHIDRGYQDLAYKLGLLGAAIERGARGRSRQPWPLSTHE